MKNHEPKIDEMNIYQMAIKIGEKNKYPNVTLDQILKVLKDTNNKVILALPILQKLNDGKAI